MPVDGLWSGGSPPTAQWAWESRFRVTGGGQRIEEFVGGFFGPGSPYCEGAIDPPVRGSGTAEIADDGTFTVAAETAAVQARFDSSTTATGIYSFPLHSQCAAQPWTAKLETPAGRCFGQAPTISASGKIDGTPGRDVILGSAGNDQIDSGGGDDLVCAGSGNDHVTGGANQDRISGGPGNDTLSGAAGNDRLSGGSGNDRLAGGRGRDKLNCGPGRDRARLGRGDQARRCETT